VATKLRIFDTFKKDYKRLPFKIKDKVDKQLEFLIKNPSHPSLSLHPICGTKGIWEGYIDYHYRFTFEIDSDFYVFRRVGTHDIIKKS